MLHRPVLLITIVLSAICCCAQTTNFDSPAPDSPFSTRGFTASLTGKVHDTQGNPINGARVEVLDPSSGRSVATSFSLPDGSYEISNLRHAEYEVVASSGVTESRSRIEVDSDRDLSFQLPVNGGYAGTGTNAVSINQMKVPGKARRLFEKAEQAFSKSRIDEAFGFVQKALICYPNYARALVLRGILNMQKGDDKDAQPDLEKAVQLDYSDDMGFVALASLYNNEGQFDRAQQTVDHGISLNPNSWQANMEMARAQIGKKDYGAALRSLDRAVSLAPPSMTLLALYRAQALIGLRDYPGAIGALQAFLEKSPNDANSEQARTTLVKLREFTASAQK